jgi:hypothetical protein
MINNQEKKWSKLSMISLGLFILAIISMKIGLPIIGFPIVPLVSIIGSIVLSIISLNQIKKYKLLGKSLAIISLTLSGIILVLNLFFICLLFINRSSSF